jgi:hypothetical protein
VRPGGATGVNAVLWTGGNDPDRHDQWPAIVDRRPANGRDVFDKLGMTTNAKNHDSGVFGENPGTGLEMLAAFWRSKLDP